MKNTISQEQINDTAVSLGIPTIPFFQRRIARAYDLVETNKVNEISHDDGLYRVHSQYDDKIYTVEINHGNPNCTCPDGKKTVFCKHMIASMLTAFEQEQELKLTVKETPNAKVKVSWVVVEDGKTYVNVWQDLNGKICCVCGAYYKRDCIHKQAIRDFYADGNGSKITNECGTETAKALQDKLNGSNGKGGNSHPSTQLDTSDPFQECEQLDIDQIEGRSNGDLAHKLNNGEYVVSYRGIMKLATKHNIDFPSVLKDNKAVIAYAKKDGQSRLSGKPVRFYNNVTNAEGFDLSSITPRANAVDTAIELAKRNAARQLLPLPEIKALEHKVKLECEFDWQVAKRKCLELVPDFTFDILIHDLVKAGTLRQAHPSDYSRKEWLLIFDACKRDAETNGNDADGGDDTPSSDEQVSCAICSRTLTNPESVRLQVGPICREKIGIKGEAHLHGNIISDELIQASQLYQDEVLQKRILRACLTLDAPAPVKVLRWLGNEYFGYQNRPILYYVCADGQLNRIDTHRRRLRHVIVTSETAETELDAHALAQMAVDVADPSERKAEVPDNADEFIAKCKEMESAVLESHASAKPTAVRSTAKSGNLPRAEVDDPAPMVDLAPANGDGKRMLRMDKNNNIVLIEPDGTQTPITMRDTAFTYGSSYVLRLTTGIACGGDVSTVELDD